jgi:hypothetical protein
MQHITDRARQASEYELRFRSLFNPGAGYAFPCDASGEVDLDSLSERGRNHYFFARTAVGCEFHLPTVAPVLASPTDRR